MLPGYLPRTFGRLSKLVMAACAAWGCSQAEDEGQLHCLVGCDEKVVKLHFSKELEHYEPVYMDAGGCDYPCERAEIEVQVPAAD